ncbi:MAG: hypothetical protein WC666_00950 [Candidatus Paceibacterota bacterium]|jgi:hypothetical protein
MNPNENGIKTWQWVITVIVIIALIVIGIMVFGGKNSQMPVVEETPITDELGLNRIIMSDQYPGNVVYISSVQVANPSWVVIQDDNNGLPGKIIGSAHFDKGISPGKINLTKPMIDGSTYYAVIYTDDGKTTFNVTTNVPLKDAKGNIIMKVFRASTSVGEGFKG